MNQKKVGKLFVNHRKNRKFIIIISIIIILIATFIFTSRIIYLGYNIDHMKNDETNKTIELGVPKLSFMKKVNEKNYSYKNLRSNKLLTKEVKSYLNTLEATKCSDSTYYYNSKYDYTIIDYSIKNHHIYNTISYSTFDGNYCLIKKVNEYAKKLGGVKRIHSINGGIIRFDEDWNYKFEVVFIDGEISSDNIYDFNARLNVRYHIRKNYKEYDTYTLEDSTGTYEIKDDKLYYYRTEIKEKSNDITIPDTSVFKIDDGKLILIDNYLSDYQKDIILK